MRRELRRLGKEGQEYTILVTEVRSVFNPVVLFGNTPVFHSEMYRGSLDGPVPFRSLKTGEPADQETQEAIEEFIKTM
jgi:hypothetical protein